MKNVNSYLPALCLALLAASCASPGRSMALTDGTAAIDTSLGSVALLALETSNEVSPSYHPDVAGIRVRTVDLEGAADEAGGKDGEWFQTGEAARGADGSYLLSFQLAPGRYEVTDVKGGSSALLIYGRFKFPMGLLFELGEGEVAYLGHVAMVNRDRLEGEPRSGSIFPLIDQGVTGFAKGTFDVTLTDRLDQDRSAFEAAYPILSGREIRPRVGELISAPAD